MRSSNFGPRGVICPTGGDAAHFLTRWVTHFCAPSFVFFAGTSAFLHGRKHDDSSALSMFLLKRGLLLVFMELTIIRLGWTFNFDFKSFTLAGVIWMFGWCMMLLALLVRFSARTVGIIGICVMVLQSVIHPIADNTPALQGFRNFLFLGGPVKFGSSGYTLEVLYTIVPWVGIMAGGYGFGSIMVREPSSRDRICIRLGLGMTLGWIVIGSVLALKQGGDASGGGAPFWIKLLNQSKYRDSQIFLLMTLGPAIAFLPYLNRMRGWLANILSTYGKAPLFYYVLHIWLIHIATLITFTIVRGGYESTWFASAPYASVPKNVQWSLGTLYLVWAVCVALLYFPCRWMARAKANAKVDDASGWLSYF